MYNFAAEGVQFTRRNCSIFAPKDVQLGCRIQRWNTKTAQSLLTLRAKEASNLWHRDVAALVLRRYDRREQLAKW
jgi:hypothetical protein